jgi:DNA-binding NtrC family response regulator
MHMIRNRKIALVIDDAEEARIIYSAALKSIGFEPIPLSAIPTKDFFENRHIDLILLDMQLGQINSIGRIKEISKHSNAKIVVLTAFGCIEKAVEAVRNGAAGFFVKSDPIDSLLPKIQALFSNASSHNRVEHFLDECGIKGRSKCMLELAQLIMQVGPTGSTVLINGSSGAGKELIAQGIHKASACTGPFVAINCSAIPEQLLESELFGVKRGAFTDAKQDRQGVLDAASGGTIFLDEIGELQPALQAKLLRVIQECEFTPVGGNQPVKLKSRIVCATNRNLIQMMNEQKFREDLYYRIAVITLRAPNLSERTDDIPILVEHFLSIFNRKCGKHLALPRDSEMESLCQYEWPGNVRELQNAVERATVLGTGDRLPIQLMLPPTQFSTTAKKDSPDKIMIRDFNYKSTIDQFEKDFLTQLLSASRGNMSEAARMSGIYRANIYRMAKRLDINLAKGEYRHGH